MKKKKLQLITGSLFIVTILIMISGFLLISLYHLKEIWTIKHYNEKIIINYNGFDLLKHYNLNSILVNNCKFSNRISGLCTIQISNHHLLLQLQIGLILLIIITPILTFIIIILTNFLIIVKIKSKINNNFEMLLKIAK